MLYQLCTLEGEESSAYVWGELETPKEVKLDKALRFKSNWKVLDDSCHIIFALNFILLQEKNPPNNILLKLIKKYYQ